MAENNNPNPTTDEETDISKAQSQQQPPEQAGQELETDESKSGFVGTKGQQDASSELVEDKDDEESRGDGE